MNLLSIPSELQLFIYFDSLNFSNLVNLTKSLIYLMLTCKNLYNLIFNENSLTFWIEIWKRLKWNYIDIINIKSEYLDHDTLIKILWSYFNPQKFITFKELNNHTMMLYNNGIFINYNRLSLPDELPSSLLNRKFKKCNIKLNDNFKLRISPSGKFIATYKSEVLTIYKNENVFNVYEFHIYNWELCESCRGEPVIISYCDMSDGIFVKHNDDLYTIAHDKSFRTFIGGLLLWDWNAPDNSGIYWNAPDNSGIYKNLRIYNFDTKVYTDITCVKNRILIR